MATFETVLIRELKTRLRAKLMPLVGEYKEKVSTSRRGKLVLEKGDDGHRGDLLPGLR